jgi:hypothetical protein
MKRTNIETYDLLKPIVESLNKTIEVTNVTTVGSDYKIFSCDTKWLTLGYTVTINSVDYLVIDIQPNEWVLLSGSIQPPVENFDLYPLYFHHNTILEQNTVMGRVEQSKDKLPLIYLHDITREKYFIANDTLIERESDCDLYFLVDADFEQWTTEQHHKYAILPMRNTLFQLVDLLINYKYTDLQSDYEVYNHARFGVYTDRGNTKRMFNDDLSGVQLKITISFLDKLSCDNC